MIIIGIAGAKSSGKSTLANHLFYQLIDISKTSPPSCKIFNWADALKDFCINILGLSYEMCHGNEDHKNVLTRYSWDKMPMEVRMNNSQNNIPRTGFMTARNVMQVVGTDIIRKFFSDDIWINATVSKMNIVNPLVALIADTRFKAEVNALLDLPDTYLIYLKRNPYKDNHWGEKDLEDYDFSIWGERFLEIDNSNMKEQDKNDIGTEFLRKIFKS